MWSPFLRRTRTAALCALILCPLAVNAQQRVDYSELSAADAARLIREGKITSEDLVTALLEQIDAGSSLHAFITVDRAGALKAAKEADRQYQAGAALAPLHGVPVVIKDNIHVAGLPNTAGTPALRTFVPTENAPVARALIEAGAIVIGKTNMHELAFGITSNNAAFGAVLTPYDQRRFAGGSSGGSGAAIAARMAPAGLGSDTGGSVRIPAALNGIAGLRPTIGRYNSNEVTLNGKRVPTFFTFIANTDPGSNAGIPGLALPMGMTAVGLPLGIELDGPSGSDRRLLSIGLALEALLGAAPAPRQ